MPWQHEAIWLERNPLGAWFFCMELNSLWSSKKSVPMEVAKIKEAKDEDPQMNGHQMISTSMKNECPVMTLANQI